MTEEQILSFVDLVEWAEMLDAHPVDVAQEIEREIDAELPYPTIVTGGEVVEVRPYRQFVDLEGVPV